MLSQGRVAPVGIDRIPEARLGHSEPVGEVASSDGFSGDVSNERYNRLS